ncbi:MAG: hypothetical protein AABZ32_09090 [Bacteroidota bacterium]
MNIKRILEKLSTKNLVATNSERLLELKTIIDQYEIAQQAKTTKTTKKVPINKKHKP